MRNSLGSPGEPTWQLDKQRQQITWSTPTYRKRLMTTCRTLKKLHSSSSSSRLPLPLPPPLPLALPLALLIILPSFAPITFLETTLHVLKTEALARWGPVPPSLCAVHVPNHKKFVDHGLDGKLFGKGSEGIRDEGNTTLNKCNCCSQYDYGGHTRLHPGEHALFFYDSREDSARSNLYTCQKHFFLIRKSLPHHIKPGQQASPPQLVHPTSRATAIELNPYKAEVRPQTKPKSDRNIPAINYTCCLLYTSPSPRD